MGVLAVGALGSSALTACSGGGDEPAAGADTQTDVQEPGKSVDSALADMSWEEILAEANGDKVTFCAWGSGGADAMVEQYWAEVKVRAQQDFGLEIEYVEDTAEFEERFISDYTDGIDATIDMFWGASASIGAQLAAGALWGDDGNQWVKKLPNNQYLDWTSSDTNLNGTIPNDYYQSPFMKVTPAMVFAADRYDGSLAWDATSEDGRPGLFHNLSELYQWVQKYPGKFTYLDLLGKGGFHGTQFVTSVLYELTDDGSGGWKPVYDEGDTTEARSAKIQAHAEEWFAWATSDAATEEEFLSKSGYVWKYLNDLKPYLFQLDGAVHYGADAYEMVSYVNSGDIATSFTTCVSIFPKTQSDPSYLPNAQLFLMETSVGYPDFITIAKNSTHKAAAMVLSNLLLEPDMNARVTALTGNAYNLDISKLDDADAKIFTDMMADFPKGTAAPPEQLVTSAHNVSSGAISKWLGTVWDAQVVQA
ncbi:MAG: hypothetical protein LBO07_03800 [Coriobacteriales bacterium]|jgi:putative spermidine/putrescine transport system substrate-binding protein|nr:hypothetical protein [Coriobacteriales bacterium]